MKIRTLVIIISIVTLIAACEPADTTNVDAPQRPPVRAEVGDEVPNNDNILASSTSTNADLEGITLMLFSADILAAQEGASNGALEIAVGFQNSTGEAVTLPYTKEDYSLVDTSGLVTSPTEASDALSNITIPAGETISGTLKYPVLAPNTTHILEVGDFESLAVDANATTAEDG